MRGAAKLIDALDAEGRRAEPFDPRQTDEEVAQVDDLRLDGRAVDDCDALGEHGGAEDVGRAGDGGAVGAGRSIVAPIKRGAVATT